MRFRSFLTSDGKGKGKDHPRADHEGPEGEYTYSSNLSLTSVLEGPGQCHTPAALPPGKTRYMYMRLLVPGAGMGRSEKSHPYRDSIAGPFQPVVSHYTNWATLAHTTWSVLSKVTETLISLDSENRVTNWIADRQTSRRKKKEKKQSPAPAIT